MTTALENIVKNAALALGNPTSDGMIAAIIAELQPAGFRAALDSVQEHADFKYRNDRASASLVRWVLDDVREAFEVEPLLADVQDHDDS